MHPLRKEARESEISHLDSSETKRGEYRITNPYELIAGADNNDGGFGLPTFDDIFGAPSTTNAAKPKQAEPMVTFNVEGETPTTTGNMFKGVAEPQVESPSVAPVTSVEPPDDYDLQAELEKRFDELFGAPKKKNTYAE